MDHTALHAGASKFVVALWWGFLLLFVFFLVDDVSALVLPNGHTLRALADIAKDVLFVYLLLSYRDRLLTRVSLTPGTLTVRKPGKAAEAYAIDELSAWSADVPMQHEGTEHRLAYLTGLRVFAGDREVATVADGVMDRSLAETRSALKHQLPYVDNGELPAHLRRRSNRSKFTLCLYAFCGYAGILIAAFPGDRLLRIAHFNEDFVSGILEAPPELRIRPGYIAVSLPLADAPDGEPWTFGASADEGPVDTAALRALTRGSEVTLARTRLSMSLLTATDSEPSTAKHIFVNGERVASGGLYDERPLSNWEWGVLGLGVLLIVVGGVGAGRAWKKGEGELSM